MLQTLLFPVFLIHPLGSSPIQSINFGDKSADTNIAKEDFVMVEKNLKKLQAKKRRVTNGFNTGTRDMKLKTAYRRKKRWSADDAGHLHFITHQC